MMGNQIDEVMAQLREADDSDIVQTIDVMPTPKELVRIAVEVSCAIREKVIQDELRKLGWHYVPPGWKLVPEVLTDEMIVAPIGRVWRQEALDEDAIRNDIQQQWAERLAAAPEPPAGPESGK